MAKRESRCWPGYEPVKGKKPHEQGSCKPKAESKLTASQKEFRGQRGKQLAAWQKEHPGTKTKTAAKKATAKKKSGETRKSSASR